MIQPTQMAGAVPQKDMMRPVPGAPVTPQPAAMGNGMLAAAVHSPRKVAGVTAAHGQDAVPAAPPTALQREIAEMLEARADKVEASPEERLRSLESALEEAGVPTGGEPREASEEGRSARRDDDREAPRARDEAQERHEPRRNGED